MGLKLSFVRPILFDPNLHPRGPHGKFIRVLSGLQVGEKVRLPDGITVQRKKTPEDGDWWVVSDIHRTETVKHIDDAAKHALNKSLQSDHRKSWGGSDVRTFDDLVQQTYAKNGWEVDAAPNDRGWTDYEMNYFQNNDLEEYITNSDINNELRLAAKNGVPTKDRSRLEATVRRLDDLMVSHFNEPTVVLRGISDLHELINFAGLNPKESGDIVQKGNLHVLSQESVEELIGQELVDFGYQSTTTRKSVASEFANGVGAHHGAIMHIRVPEDVRFAPVDDLVENIGNDNPYIEAEFVLQRGNTFVIDDVIWDPREDTWAVFATIKNQEKHPQNLSLSFRPILFDPRLHPRGPHGKFIRVLGELRTGQKVQLPDGISVQKGERGWEVTVPTERGEAKSTLTSAYRAANEALGESMHSNHPESWGGSEITDYRQFIRKAYDDSGWGQVEQAKQRHWTDYRMDENEASTLDTYVHDSKINARLRQSATADTMDQEERRRLRSDAAYMDKLMVGEFDKPTVVYRGIEDLWELMKYMGLKPTKAKGVDREMHSMSPESIEQLVGQEMIDFGYQSTSTESGISSNFAGTGVSNFGAIMHIRAPEGTQFAPVHDLANKFAEWDSVQAFVESELILQRGNTLNIDDVIWDPHENTWLILASIKGSAKHPQNLSLSLLRPILFDPRLHPRGPHGKFIRVLKGMEIGDTVEMPGGILIAHEMKKGRFNDKRPVWTISTADNEWQKEWSTDSVAQAATEAIKTSMLSEHPDTIGGRTITTKQLVEDIIAGAGYEHVFDGAELPKFPVDSSVTNGEDWDAGIEALMSYQNSSGINKRLRDTARNPKLAEKGDTHSEFPSAMDKEFIRKLDFMTESSTADQDMVLYRGVAEFADLLAHMNVNSATGYNPDLRELHDVDPEQAKQIVGREFTDFGFVSTSSSIEAARYFGTTETGAVLHIIVPKGTRFASMSDIFGETQRSSYESEQEILLSRAMKYRVVDMVFDSNRKRYDVVVEVVDETKSKHPLGLSLLRPILFDPRLHPRDPKGRFLQVVRNVDTDAFGEKLPSMAVHLPDGTVYERKDKKDFVNGKQLKIPDSLTGPESGKMIANAVFDASAQNTHPDSIGGETAYRNWDDYVDKNAVPGTPKEGHDLHYELMGLYKDAPPADMPSKKALRHHIIWHPASEHLRTLAGRPPQTPAEQAAYEKIQESMETFVQPMDNLIESMPPLERESVVYRGVKVLGDIFDREFSDYKTPGFERELVDLIDEEFVDFGYQSTTTDYGIARTFARWAGDKAVIVLTVPKGQRGAYVPALIDDDSTAQRENEFILPRGVKYRITNIDYFREDSEQVQIYAEVVDSESVALGLAMPMHYQTWPEPGGMIEEFEKTFGSMPVHSRLSFPGDIIITKQEGDSYDVRYKSGSIARITTEFSPSAVAQVLVARSLESDHPESLGGASKYWIS